MELQSVAQTVRALGRQSAHVLGRMQFLLDEVEAAVIAISRNPADEVTVRRGFYFDHFRAHLRQHTGTARARAKRA